MWLKWDLWWEKRRLRRWTALCTFPGIVGSSSTVGAGSGEGERRERRGEGKGGKGRGGQGRRGEGDTIAIKYLNRRLSDNMHMTWM